MSYLDGISGPRPLIRKNLAGTWNFQPLSRTPCTFDAGLGPKPGCVTRSVTEPVTTVEVPGGGWVKQGFTDVSEAIYSRRITIPDSGQAQVTQMQFGAINHEATLHIEAADDMTPGPGQLVGTTMTSFTPATFDLTPYVERGRSYFVTVQVKGRMALRDPAGYFTVPEAAGWSPNVAQGIFRTVHLNVFPTTWISDVVVRTSVTSGRLAYDVTVTNQSAKAQDVAVEGSLRSANRRGWAYPTLPRKRLTVPAGQTRTITVGPVLWKAPPASYWWPNVPFRPGYRAQLHDLTVEIAGERSEGPKPASAMVRFGFRETRQVGDHYELNGVPVNFRGDSFQGANYDSINHAGGRGDAFGTFPGFLAPSQGNPGWPKVVRNFQRLNYNVVRIHQVPGTPYMLDVADRLGLMLVGETAIRGSNVHENFLTGRDNMVEHVKALVRRDRNHASILRWSVSNEPNGATGVNSETQEFSDLGGTPPGSGAAFDEELYQAAKSEDTTRPIISDGNPTDLPHPDYTTTCHYDPNGDRDPSQSAIPTLAIGRYTDDVCESTPSAGKPNGQTEFIWSADNTKQGFTWFATATKEMREKGADDTRPYTLLSAWSSIVPGVERSAMTLEQNVKPLYGEENLLRPWRHPQIRLLQKGFAPVLVADTDYWEMNKLSDTSGSWPVSPVRLARSARVTRDLVIFNDTFSGEAMTIGWNLRADSPAGPKVAGGKFHARVPLGAHRNKQINFTPPAGDKRLFLVLWAKKAGFGRVFTDRSTYFM